MIFEINNLTGHDTEDITTYLFNVELEKDLYIELWTTSEFREYFNNAKVPIVNPVDGLKHLPRGFHSYDNDRHEVAIIYEPEFTGFLGWERILKHELVHCKQCEKLGITLYLQLADIYKEDRINDPFELQAYWEETR
jgi:hypothetical protein